MYFIKLNRQPYIYTVNNLNTGKEILGIVLSYGLP